MTTSTPRCVTERIYRRAPRCVNQQERTDDGENVNGDDEAKGVGKEKDDNKVIELEPQKNISQIH